MRTRKMVTNVDHVGALNQVQLEFFKHTDVLPGLQVHTSQTSPIRCRTPGNALDNFLARRSDLFFDLLHTIAKASDAEIPPTELIGQLNVPFGWQAETK